MFLRVARAPSGKTGVKHEYVRVVEAYRDHEGKTRHQTIINLGRKDLVAAHLWRELGLEKTIDTLSAADRADAASLSDRALVLVANRLVAPSSEHALAQWLESDFICDRRGRRFLPAWREDAQRKASRMPRVRVEMRQLQQWYRTIDQLLASKGKIELELFVHLRDLFSLQVDLVFYERTT